MEEFSDFIRVYHSNLIKGMFFSVLAVMLLHKFFPDIVSKTTYSILRWVIIIYSFLSILSISINLGNEEYNYFERATGPYWWSYWLMTICAFGLPFLLLHKKLRHKRWLLLNISVLVNIGWLFELFVITMTNLHRDYPPSGWPEQSYIAELLFLFGILAIHGFFIGLFVVLIENIMRRYRKKHIFANH